MPRDMTATSGQQAAAAQFPISLVMLNIPGFTKTTDVWGESPVVGSSYTAGAGTIHMTGLGSGSLSIGDHFKIGEAWYTVNANVTIVAGAADVTFIPSLVEDVSAGAAVFTIAFNLNDIDTIVYLNPTTNAVSMAPGAGLIPFVPYAGMSVPQFEMSDTGPLGDMSIELSNIRGDWSYVLAANRYRETLATMWQGNLSIPDDAPPDAVTFTGVVTMWIGRLVGIQPRKPNAILLFSPHITPWTISFPYRTYTASGFPKMPTPNFTLLFGFTERQLD